MLPSLLVRLGTRTPLLGRKVTICFIQRCWIEVGRSQSYHKNSVSVWMYFANKPIYIYISIYIYLLCIDYYLKDVFQISTSASSIAF